MMWIILCSLIAALIMPVPAQSKSDADEVEELYDRIDKADADNAELRGQLADMQKIMAELKETREQQRIDAAELKAIKEKEKQWEAERAHITSLPGYKKMVAEGNAAIGKAAGEAERKRKKAEADAIAQQGDVVVEIIGKQSAKERARIKCAGDPAFVSMMQPIIDAANEASVSVETLRASYKSRSEFMRAFAWEFFKDNIGNPSPQDIARIYRNPDEYIDKTLAHLAPIDADLAKDCGGMNLHMVFRQLLDRPELWP